VTEDIVQLLLKRAEIRRQIPTRKSVAENKPDRISDLLEAAASEILRLRVELKSIQNKITIDSLEYDYWEPINKEFWDAILKKCKGLTPIDSGVGTHCWDATYQVGNRMYNILYENGQSWPIDITAKDIGNNDSKS